MSSCPIFVPRPVTVRVCMHRKSKILSTQESNAGSPCSLPLIGVFLFYFLSTLEAQAAVGIWNWVQVVCQWGKGSELVLMAIPQAKGKVSPVLKSYDVALVPISWKRIINDIGSALDGALTVPRLHVFLWAKYSVGVNSYKLKCSWNLNKFSRGQSF